MELIFTWRMIEYDANYYYLLPDNEFEHTIGSCEDDCIVYEVMIIHFIDYTPKCFGVKKCDGISHFFFNIV